MNKKLKIFIVSFILVGLWIYLMFALANCSLKNCDWSNEARGFCSFIIGIFSPLIAVGIVNGSDE